MTDSPNLEDEMYENPNLHNEKGEWQMIFGVNTLSDYRKKVSNNSFKKVI